MVNFRGRCCLIKLYSTARHSPKPDFKLLNHCKTQLKVHTPNVQAIRTKAPLARVLRCALCYHKMPDATQHADQNLHLKAWLSVSFISYFAQNVKESLHKIVEYGIDAFHVACDCTETSQAARACQNREDTRKSRVGREWNDLDANNIAARRRIAPARNRRN